MGYRLSIDAISCNYHKNEDDPTLDYHTKQLYYGTKLYGYTLDLEDKEILKIFNNPIEFEDENFLVYWC